MSVAGYHGQYLRICLPTGMAQGVNVAEASLRRFLGGSGLGALLLMHEGAAEKPPVEAALAFVFSPLVGSPLTTSAKFAVVCRSPLTGRFNDALASSGFALAGKATGYDALVLTGRAPAPSLLIIDDGNVQLVAADDFWGMNTTEAQQELKARFGRDFECAVVGPAGERGVRFASLSHDGRHAGRGAGAVLGGKNIKAVLVRGSKTCRWHDPQGLVQFAKVLSQRSFGPATAKYRELGTATNLLTFNRLHALPTRNFQRASFDGVENLAPETLQQTREKTRKSCRACTIGCEHLYLLADGQAKVRMEYESLFALGPLCGIQDAEAVLQASRLCDELGIDTISTGGTIAFAMECVEKGLWDVAWLRFGRPQALLRAIELIGCRDGIGDLLANGSRWLAEFLGQDAIKYAPQVKGLELPGYEPRTLQTMALGFAVGTRGADHNRSSAYEVDFSDRVNRRQISDEAVGHAVETEDRSALLDSIILCKFLRGVFEDLWTEAATMLQLVTGWDVDGDELRVTARRIVDMKKAFNIHAGWQPSEDTLPERFFDESLPDDDARLTRSRLQQLIRKYNIARGWHADGFLVSDAE